MRTFLSFSSKNDMTPKYIQNAGQFIYRNLLKLELILGLLIALGFLAKEMKWDMEGFVLIFSLTTLAITYYFIAFRPLTEGSVQKDKFIVRLSGMSYSISAVAVLFLFAQWPGAYFTYIISLITIGLSVIVQFGSKLLNTGSKNISVSDNLRTLAIALLIGLVYFTPEYQKAKSMSETEHAESLKEAASFPVGAAINVKRLYSDEKFQKIDIANFNSITARSEMKMHRILPSEGNYYWGAADSMVMFSTKHHQRLFGHNLIWHSSTPKWVEDKAMNDSAWLAGFMKDYIHTYVGRYKGKVDGWDVVNEGMNTFGGGYRETMWYNILGEDYIANAFIYAHEADPDAVLFYNDFNIERDTAKLNSVLQMIKKFQKEGIPISGLGFQMHIRMDIPDSIIAYALKKGAETGLQIHLSEVDIIFNKHNDSRGGGIQIYQELTDSMKAAQARKYRNLAKMYKEIVPENQQYGITFWGFNDRDTWINGFFGIKDWPCLFDENLDPKPAYYGFLEGLKEE